MIKEKRTPADEQFDMIMSAKMLNRKNTAIDTGNRIREIEAIWALNTFERLERALEYIDELEKEISELKDDK